ncbi:MAG: hypothetical protein Kow00127_12990 [Bacteroidales bacterium]
MTSSFRRKGKRRRRRKVRYRKITIKLGEKQYRSLTNYCKARQTTPNKLIKKSIRRFTTGFDIEVPQKYYVSENQLELFTGESEGE